jgi:uroporphyrinogen III methyltransferase/synthase
MGKTECGRVILVGAGPGDPSLITLLGRDWLQRADVVIHDFLLNPALLTCAPNAEIINAAQPAERHPRPLDQIIALMIEKARQGKLVVRLKGGDPLVFGRGGEEALALAEAGIPFQIVPGVTSATAVPTYAGIPITQRGVASSLAVLAGHNLEHDEAVDWPRLARSADTLLFLMGIAALPNIAGRLLAAGLPGDTPIAVVEQGTHPGQKTVVGTLGDIVPKAAGLRPPATVIVGEVVKLRPQLRWFDRPDLNPFFGLRLMTIHAGQEALAAALGRQFTAQGAEAASFSAVRMGPPPDPAHLSAILAALVEPGRSTRPWEVIEFADSQAVTSFFGALHACGGDARVLAGLRVGARSPAAAEALLAQGLVADFMGTASGWPDAGLLQLVTAPLVPGGPVDPGVERCGVCAVRPAHSPGPWHEWLAGYSGRGAQPIVVFSDPAAIVAMAQLLPALATALEGVAVVCAGPGTEEAAKAEGVTIVGATTEVTAEAIAEVLRPWRAAEPQKP